MVVGLGSESTNWEHFVIVSSFKEGRWMGRLFFNLGPSLMQSTWRRGKAFSSLFSNIRNPFTPLWHPLKSQALE
jgi:hypothetical protein